MHTCRAVKTKNLPQKYEIKTIQELNSRLDCRTLRLVNVLGFLVFINMKNVLIEKVQRRFTKRLPGLKHMSYMYNERLHYLAMLVESRITTFAFGSDKIVFGVVDLNFSDFFLNSAR